MVAKGKQTQIQAVEGSAYWRVAQPSFGLYWCGREQGKARRGREMGEGRERERMAERAEGKGGKGFGEGRRRRRWWWWCMRKGEEGVLYSVRSVKDCTYVRINLARRWSQLCSSR